MSERAKPFVAWMDRDNCWDGITDQQLASVGGAKFFARPCPVVVTPLLPDDPRPGETWLLDTTEQAPVKVLCAPSGRRGEMICEYTDGDLAGRVCYVTKDFLRRAPVLKTFRVTMDFGHRGWCSPEIRATSREEAVRKLADALEEVP